MTFETYDCGLRDCTLAKAPRATRDVGLDFLICDRCGSLRIPNEQLDRLEVPPDAEGTTISLPMRILFGMRDLWFRSVLPPFRDKRSRILDVGCGDGQFLQFLGQRGFTDCIGVEVNPERAAHAKLRGVEVFPDLEAARQDRGPFDIVFIWHVLEHVEQPVELLRQLEPLLAEDGVIVVGVPNQSSLQNRLFGRLSSLIDYGRHVWYWRTDYFRWLRQQHPGWDVERLAERNFEYELFSWLDSLVSVLLGRQNVVHKALKKGDAGLGEKLLALFLCAALAPIGALLAIATLVVREGSSTLTYVIRKGRPT